MCARGVCRSTGEAAVPKGVAGTWQTGRVQTLLLCANSVKLRRTAQGREPADCWAAQSDQQTMRDRLSLSLSGGTQLTDRDS